MLTVMFKLVSVLVVLVIIVPIPSAYSLRADRKETITLPSSKIRFQRLAIFPLVRNQAVTVALTALCCHLHCRKSFPRNLSRFQLPLSKLCPSLLHHALSSFFASFPYFPYGLLLFFLLCRNFRQLAFNLTLACIRASFIFISDCSFKQFAKNKIYQNLSWQVKSLTLIPTSESSPIH